MDRGTEIRFDGWTLNRQSGELQKDGARVRLQTHPQQVLEALLERPGELVTREELIARLWPRGVVDFDTALNSTVRRLRTALGDDADAPRYIETLPRRGYRYIGTIDPVRPAPAPAPVEGPQVPPTIAVAASPARPKRWVALALLLAAGAVVLAWQWFPAWEQGAAQGPSSSAAPAEEAYRRAKFVLDRRGPGDVERALQYFDEAIRHDSRHARAWSGLASATWIQTVEGRAPRAQGLSRVRDAAERALEIDPTMAEPHLRLANYRWAVGNPAAAHAHLRRATELEPHNPLVLSFASGKAAEMGRLDEAIELQRRAVEADPLAAVHRYNLATILFLGGEVEAAETELRRLLALAPEAPGVRELLGLVLVQQGRYDDALALVAGAPADIQRLQVQALAYYASGRLAEADASLAAMIANCAPHERIRVAEVYAYRGDLDQAFAWLEPAPPDAAGEVPWFERRSPFLSPLHADPRWQAWIGASKQRIGRRVAPVTAAAAS